MKTILKRIGKLIDPVNGIWLKVLFIAAIIFSILIITIISEYHSYKYQIPVPGFHKPLWWEGLVELIIIVWLILAVYYLFKRDALYNPRKLDYTTIRLNALAKNKLHNVRNNYNQVSDLIYKKEFETVKEYVDRSAYYMSYSLNTWDKNKWSVKDELKLLDLFYQAESTIGKEVEIITQFDDFNVEETVFIPEILTTLLHNSMKHAFKEDNCVFKIIMKRKKNLLFCEISDNGTPSKKECYIREDRPDKGLNILRQRLLNEFRIKNFKKEIFYLGNFDIEPIEGIGTTIKFTLPYATTS